MMKERLTLMLYTLKYLLTRDLDVNALTEIYSSLLYTSKDAVCTVITIDTTYL